MIRFYYLFVTDDQLLVSPFIKNFNIMHGTTLHRGQSEVINFLIQTTLTNDQCKNLNIIYDELSLRIEDIKIKTFKFQTIVSVLITPKEIGSMRIGLKIPRPNLTSGYRLKKTAFHPVKKAYNQLSR